MLEFGDIGDPRAAPGTPEHAKWHSYSIVSSWRQAQNPMLSVKSLLQSFVRNEWYKLLHSSKGKLYESWEEWCQDHPPTGLGMNPDYARAIIEEVDVRLLRVTLAGYEKHFTEKTGASTRAVVEADVAGPAPKHGEIGNGRSRPDPIRSTSYGTSPAYLAARIKRDHPEIHARTLAGEFASTKAAARAAGIVKTKDPVDAVVSGYRKLSPEDKKRFDLIYSAEVPSSQR